MNETQFETFIRRIRNAYGTKQLPDEVLEFLFEECGYIPQEATKWIFDRFMSENDKLPAKLHLAILRIYYDWGRGQGEPQKQISRTCPINMPDEDGPCYDGNLFVGRDSYSLASQFDNTPPPADTRVEPVYQYYEFQGQKILIEARLNTGEGN